ncbi:hypothetical protein N7486_000542 [Penicillium sp. IBT 16267x]|nr:hypothetical protein N7486_000542 [Penicillium sp. IBT 16267x]
MPLSDLGIHISLQEPDRVGQTNRGIVSNVPDLHSHKLEVGRKLVLEGLSICDSGVIKVTLIRDKASLLVVHALDGKEGLGTTRASVNLVTDLSKGVLHVDVELHRFARTFNDISVGILDSSDDSRLLAAASVDDSGGNTVHGRGRVGVTATDGGGELPSDEELVPFLNGLLIGGIKVGIPNFNGIVVVPVIEAPVAGRAGSEGVVDGNEATGAVNLLSSIDEARDILVTPIDELLAVDAGSLPMSVASSHLDGTADQEIRGEGLLVSADNVVAGVSVVVGEEDKREILSHGMLDLLIRGVLSVGVDRVHMEVPAEPLLLLELTDGVKVDLCKGGRELISTLVENAQVQGVTIALEGVVLQDIDRGGFGLNFERNVDKGHDLGSINMASQVEGDGSPSRDTSHEGH